ncbi:MAG: archease [Gemmatimonadales bacterium]
MTYRFLPHTADVRVAVEAPTFEALLAESAAVLRELLAGTSEVAEREERWWRAEGGEHAELFGALLRELLFQFHSDGFIPRTVIVDEVRRGAARGRAFGERFDQARHEPQPEVKAVTRHGLVAEPSARGWRAEVVFDV